MNIKNSVLAFTAALLAASGSAQAHGDTMPPAPIWATVVNNGDLMPGSTKNFNSYNQPSVNASGLVVFRARGKGPGEPPHGIYTRDMSIGGPIVRIADRTSLVPQPNNLGTTFIEFPSFPRIDSGSRTLATRGNSQPVWRYMLPDGTETRTGTTGIFTNPAGTLLTGISKLGAVPEFSYLQVPGAEPGTTFDVFPGAPSPTRANLIVFKGNYTDPYHDGSETGVYFRPVLERGGKSPAYLIANNVITKMPGTNTVFGSTAPPSAAGDKAVFAGFDNEENPTIGGIYLTKLEARQRPGDQALRTLVSIGGRIPDLPGKKFELIGEGLSFDGRQVGFWAAWDKGITRQVVQHCRDEGNKLLREYCLTQCPEPGGCTFQVPRYQGFFVHDIEKGTTRLAARTGITGGIFEDYLFWNFSGKAPGVGEGDEDGELARWRSAAFIAVQSSGDRFQAAFKASSSDQTIGIYLATGAKDKPSSVETLVDTHDTGDLLDSEPEAFGLPITEVGLERDGFRNGRLAINAGMGSEETGWAGIYLARIKKP
jgi:hypothetical protein